MKKLFFVLGFAFLFGHIQAQDNNINDYYEVETIENPDDKAGINNENEITKPKKFNFSLELGTSFSTGGYSSQFASPMFNYDFSPRFTLSGGMMFANNFIPTNSYFGAKGNFMQNYVFARGKYKLSEKFSLNGSVFYETTSMMKRNTNDFPQPNNNAKIMTFGAEYKFSKNLSIGIQFQTRENSNPYLPYSSPNNTVPYQPRNW